MRMAITATATSKARSQFPFLSAIDICVNDRIARDNNLEEITPIFCELDHLTIKTRKAKLLRDKTLANGDDMCDFWIVGDKVKDPK